MISVVNFHTGATDESLSLLPVFPKWSPSMATVMIDDGNQVSRWGRKTPPSIYIRCIYPPYRETCSVSSSPAEVDQVAESTSRWNLTLKLISRSLSLALYFSGIYLFFSSFCLGFFFLAYPPFGALCRRQHHRPFLVYLFYQEVLFVYFYFTVDGNYSEFSLATFRQRLFRLTLVSSCRLRVGRDSDCNSRRN